MKLKAGHKVILFLVATIAAAVLCTLPFLVVKKDVIYVYTENLAPSSAENGFINELQRSGYKVVVNSSSLPTDEAYGFWFKSPEYAEQIEQSPAKLNFLYTEAYYPIEWKNTSKHPIVLTPYRLLFEHYMRSNIKSAMMTLGVNLAEYYPSSAEKKYNVLYYGDNNQDFPFTELLQNRADTKFFGAYWDKRDKVIETDEEKGIKANDILSLSKIVVIYHQPDSPQSKKVPADVMQATASGTLVFSSPNAAIIEDYQDNIIIYENEQDLQEKLDYYLKNYTKVQAKILAAQKITAEKFSTSATNKRFQELLGWLKENQTIKPND